MVLELEIRVFAHMHAHTDRHAHTHTHRERARGEFSGRAWWDESFEPADLKDQPQINAGDGGTVNWG